MAQINYSAKPTNNCEHIATAHVETAKASRYLKALCNHFARKVIASYDDNRGTVQFPFGDCSLEVVEDGLLVHVAAESEAMLARVKYVVADHLVRFAANEELAVPWAAGEDGPNK